MTDNEKIAMSSKAKLAELSGNWSKAAKLWHKLGDTKQANACREIVASNTATIGFLSKIFKSKKK